MNRYGGFTLGDKNSRDYGLIMTAPPPIVLAERDVVTAGVAGLSGDLVYDNGRFRNVTVPYSCAIFPEDGRTLRETVMGAVALLQPCAGYRRLVNTFHPEVYRMARVASEISVESIVEQAGRFTVTFDCKPQRFLAAGEIPVKVSDSGVLHNPTGFASKPLISVFALYGGTLTVGDTEIVIKPFPFPIILDSEIQQAYHRNDPSGIKYVNDYVTAPVFPELQPGETEIRWEGQENAGIMITPRWWTL